MPAPLIELCEVSKEFRVASAGPPSLFNQVRRALWLGGQMRVLRALSNVSLELELNSMRENRLLYEAYSSMLRSHFSLLETAISEGR